MRKRLQIERVPMFFKAVGPELERLFGMYTLLIRTTFIQANNSTGNYAMFTTTGTGFTLTATPGQALDGNPQAPVNGIQIDPRRSDFVPYGIGTSHARKMESQS